MDNFNIKIMSCCHKKIERDEERETESKRKEKERIFAIIQSFGERITIGHICKNCKNNDNDSIYQ